MERESTSVRKASLIIALVAAGPVAADDPAVAAAHAAVREALLERATLPVVGGPALEQPSAQVATGHAARARQEDPERAAHSRAAAHGTRHSRDAHPEHGEGWKHGGAHGGSTMGRSGMDPEWDCHDPAENERTRGVHDGSTHPERDGPHQP
jgi:hypothetical protein